MRPQPHPGYDLSKRAVDLALGTILVIALLPLIATSMLLVVLWTRSNPLFRQRRIGLQGGEFTMLKIRTMWPGAERLVPLYLNESAGRPRSRPGRTRG